MRSSFLAAGLGLIVAVCACGPIERDGACKKAEQCDAALEQPAGGFDKDDPVFGDAGSCWQNDETAKPCIAACADYTREQTDLGDAQDNAGVVAACK